MDKEQTAVWMFKQGHQLVHLRSAELGHSTRCGELISFDWRYADAAKVQSSPHCAVCDPAQAPVNYLQPRLATGSVGTNTQPETQRTISAWAESTFGPASSNARVAARANEEMAELLRTLTMDDNDPHAVEEAADVFIVLYRLAERMGVDLHEAIDRKMQINRTRQWHIGGDGHGYHVREQEAQL